ncbi:MAG: hypothetical protein IPN29_17220 [Saprospiraceae bacterium]|nr:hypothetical protein [Saprospiraceae bacterium]
MTTANTHNGPGEIFSELLNEEVLKPKPVVEATPEGIKTRIECYTLPTVAAAPESEVKKQWQALRNFYRSGENTGGTTSKDLRPVLLASYLNSEEIQTDYPIYLSHMEAGAHTHPSTIIALLEETFKAVFNEKEGLVLHTNLPRIEAAFRKYVKDAGHYCDFAAALESAMSTLADIKIKGEDQKTFLADIEKFRNKLPQTGSLLGFSPLTLVQLLTHLLTYQSREKRNKFVHEAHNLKSKLNDLLSVENEGKTTNSAAAWDIGDSFIEFNTLDNLKPRRASESMPVKRYERITTCIRNLEAAESLLSSHHGLVFMGENLANKTGNWKNLLGALEVKLVPEGKSCLSASEGFKNHMVGLSAMFAATRMATLEINNKYEEDIHDDFLQNSAGPISRPKKMRCVLR